MARKKKYTFIDLFAGCGGLSEGLTKIFVSSIGYFETGVLPKYFTLNVSRLNLEILG